MSKLDLGRTTVTAKDGTPVHFVYDREGDILDIVFGDNEAATGIELTDHIILRLNRATKRAVSLTILHFSILTEQTEYGPRSYPLHKLDALPEEIHELVLQLVGSPPVNQFLKLSHFQASPVERVPFAFVESHPIESRPALAL